MYLPYALNVRETKTWKTFCENIKYFGENSQEGRWLCKEFFEAKLESLTNGWYDLLSESTSALQDITSSPLLHILSNVGDKIEDFLSRIQQIKDWNKIHENSKNQIQYFKVLSVTYVHSKLFPEFAWSILF